MEMLLSNADRDRKSTLNLQTSSLTFDHSPTLLHKEGSLYQWVSCFLLLEWSSIVLRWKTVIFSLDDRKFSVFAAVCSLLIYYAFAFLCPFPNFMPFVGLQGPQSVAGTMLPFKISLILLASINNMKKQDFWIQKHEISSIFLHTLG